MKFFLYLILGVMALACKKSSPEKVLTTPTSTDIAFTIADSTSAATLINTDVEEDFFARIQSLEMSVIMKQRLEPDTDRNVLLEKFKQLQAREVSDFSDAQKEILKVVSKKMQVMLDSLSTDIKIPEIQLIKLKGQLYGEGTFFTRENGIYIPDAEIRANNMEAIEGVFLHEIFHIISRYNKNIRTDCYALIGFSPLGGIPEIPEVLQKRLMHNPDGLNFEYGITLTRENYEPVIVTPMIYINSENFESDKPAYFSYLQFDLFRVSEESGKLAVVSAEPVGPEIADEYYQSFFEQIKDNTQYIIHPDEIMADNFMLAVYDKNGRKDLNLSKEGTALTHRLQAILFP